MAFSPGPVWTDVRVNAPTHAGDELLPLLPDLSGAPILVTTNEGAALELITTAAVVDEVDIMQDTGLHESVGLRELWWPDWAPLIAVVNVAFPIDMRTLRAKYLGGTGSTQNPIQVEFVTWSRDNPFLARSFCGEVLLIIVLNEPPGTVFRQDPGDPLTWGFYVP